MGLMRYSLLLAIAMRTAFCLQTDVAAQQPAPSQPYRPAPRQATRTPVGPPQARPSQDNQQPQARRGPLPGQPLPGQPAQGQPAQGQPAQGQPAQGQPVQGQAGQSQAGQGQPPQGSPQVVRAPFQLTPEEEVYLGQVLTAWESHTTKTKTFTCRFMRWNYDPAFASAYPQYKEKPIEVNEGIIRYAAPDRGTMRADKVEYFNPKTGKYDEVEDERGEHWVCNGKSVWQHNYEAKQVVEYPIPPEVQGKSIRNTPLPFLFGSKAADLRERYFLRVVTPKEYAEKEIWIDAFPRSRVDSANFQRAIMRLDRSSFKPVAMRIYDPDGSSKSYSFSKVVINSTWEQIREYFAPPRVPRGWQRVVQTPAESTAGRPSEKR